MIETMKQVLEVLEENLVWFSKDTMIGKALRKKTESAIATLRQAIEQAEKQEPVAWVPTINGMVYEPVVSKFIADNLLKLGATLEPLYTHPPKREPEPKPVAWLQFKDNEPPVVAPRDLGTPVFLGVRGGLAHDAGEKK